MFCKEISYEDYNGVQQKRKCWFHLTKAEIMEWMTTNGSYTMADVLDKMVEANRVKDIIGSTRELIYRSYGEKSLDGQRFIKSKEVKDAFMETEAYSVLFMELITDANAAAEFVTRIIPKDMAAEVEKIMATGEGIPENLKEYVGPTLVQKA